MSDTTYVHEVTRGPGVRVTLTMDAAEVRAMADIAAAAVDGCVLSPEEDSDVVMGNATNVYNWAVKAATTLEFTAGISTSDDKE
ncbi:MAG: hypothetical protein ACXVYB_00015 [Arthrobacter sp.]